MVGILKTGSADAVEKTCACLAQKGSVALVPTETVYGLVCDWSDSAARANIYSMKHRADNKPLAAFVPSVGDAEKICGRPLPPKARRLAQKFMPGPITLIVYDSKGATFGFRIPDYPFIHAVLKHYGRPLASTSANLSGTPAALNIGDALASLASPPSIVADGGALPSNSMASTVILVNPDDSWKILRPGPVPEASVAKA